MEVTTPGPYFFRNFASAALGSYGAIALSFALSAVLARRLGAEGFGQLALVLMAVQVSTTLVSSWTLTGLVRFGAEELARTGSLSETFWARAFVVAPWLLLVAVSLAVYREAVAGYLGIPQWGVWLVLAHFLVSQGLLTMGFVFQASLQMSRYGATLFLDKGVALIAILLLPYPYAGDPVYIIACYAVSSLLVFGLALALLNRRTLFVMRPGPGAVAALWRFSVPGLFATVVGIVGGQAVIYAIIRHFYSIGDLGMYSLASQIATVLQQVAIVVASLLLPRLSVMVARKQDDQLRVLVQRVLPYGLLGVALLFALAALLAKPGILWVFGEAFANAVQPLMVLIAGAMALAFFYLLVPFLHAYSLTWTVTAIASASAAVNLAAAVMLVPSHAALGAALATALAGATAACLTLVVVRRFFRVDVLRLGAMALPTVVVALCGLLLDGRLFYVAGFAGIVVTTCVLVLALHLFRPEDLAALDLVGVPVSLGLGAFKGFSPRAR